jgi:hypothetical protein
LTPCFCNTRGRGLDYRDVGEGGALDSSYAATVSPHSR